MWKKFLKYFLLDDDGDVVYMTRTENVDAVPKSVQNGEKTNVDAVPKSVQNGEKNER